MSNVIACYSFSGKTLKLCDEMAQDTGFTLVHIKELKKRGVLGAYFSGSREAMSGRSSEIVPIGGALQSADIICIAGPIWAGSPAPALNAVISSGALKGKQALCILTCANGAGNAADTVRKRIAEAGAQCAGVQVLRRKDMTDDRLRTMSEWLKQMANATKA